MSEGLPYIELYSIVFLTSIQGQSPLLVVFFLKLRFLSNNLKGMQRGRRRALKGPAGICVSSKPPQASRGSLLA